MRQILPRPLTAPWLRNLGALLGLLALSVDSVDGGGAIRAKGMAAALLHVIPRFKQSLGALLVNSKESGTEIIKLPLFPMPLVLDQAVPGNPTTQLSAGPS